MLAHAWETFDDWSRLFNRVTIIAVALWGAWICWRKVLGLGNRSLVPKWVWAFPAVWMTALIVVSGYLIATDACPLSTWERNIYGSLLNWTILGLLGVIVIGDKAVERTAKIVDRYHSAIDQAAAHEEQLDDVGSDE